MDPAHGHALREPSRTSRECEHQPGRGWGNPPSWSHRETSPRRNSPPSPRPSPSALPETFLRGRVPCTWASPGRIASTASLQCTTQRCRCCARGCLGATPACGGNPVACSSPWPLDSLQVSCANRKTECLQLSCPQNSSLGVHWLPCAPKSTLF